MRGQMSAHFLNILFDNLVILTAGSFESAVSSRQRIADLDFLFI